MKYARFIKNLFIRKNNKKNELSFTDNTIYYKILYCNNYIDTVFKLAIHYNIFKNKSLNKIDIKKLIEDYEMNYDDNDISEDERSIQINSIINEIKNISCYKELLSASSNIIIKVIIDDNSNWKRLINLFSSINCTTVIIDNDNESFLISVNLFDLLEMTKIDTIDKEIVSFIKEMVSNFLDNCLKDKYVLDQYYDGYSLGFDCNSAISKDSIVDINNSNNKCIFIGTDIVEECPKLSKVYFISPDKILIPNSTSVNFIPGITFHSMYIYDLLKNKDEDINKYLLNLIIEKNNLYDINIINNDSINNVFSLIDEII